MTDIQKIADNLECRGYYISARFAVMREVQVSWEREYPDLTICVSDYLDGMPDGTAADVLRTALARSMGEDEPYSRSLREWVASPEFAGRNQAQYLTRHGMKPYKIVDGVAFVRSEDIDLPTRTYSRIMRIVLCRPEALDNPDYEHIAIMGVRNQLEKYVRDGE